MKSYYDNKTAKVGSAYNLGWNAANIVVYAQLVLVILRWWLKFSQVLLFTPIICNFGQPLPRLPEIMDGGIFGEKLVCNIV